METPHFLYSAQEFNLFPVTPLSALFFPLVPRKKEEISAALVIMINVALFASWIPYLCHF